MLRPPRVLSQTQAGVVLLNNFTDAPCVLQGRLLDGPVIRARLHPLGFSVDVWPLRIRKNGTGGRLKRWS